MDRETFDKLKERWPEKEGRSIDPAESRIDHIVLATAGHEFVQCSMCKGLGVLPPPKMPGEGPPVSVRSEKCHGCRGEGKIPIFDTLNEVSFGVSQAWITRGNRLILVCSSDKSSHIDRTRVRKHVEA